jgi:hypothetical protein
LKLVIDGEYFATRSMDGIETSTFTERSVRRRRHPATIRFTTTHRNSELVIGTGSSLAESK